jgi:L-fucose isomerase-like protein
MLTRDEQDQIERLAARWVRAALTAEKMKRTNLAHVAPKTAEASLARAREDLRDYLKEAG